MEPIGVALYAPREFHHLYLFCMECANGTIGNWTRLQAWLSNRTYYSVKYVYPAIFKDFSQKCAMMECPRWLIRGKSETSLFPVYPDPKFILPVELREEFHGAAE